MKNSFILFVLFGLSGCVTTYVKDGKVYEAPPESKIEANQTSGLSAEVTKAKVALIPVKGPDSEKYQYKVIEVFPNTAFARAGIKSGDIILSVDGKPVSTMPEILEAPAKIDAGKFSQIAIRRNGKNYLLKAK